jgi:hypothetical protein
MADILEIMQEKQIKEINKSTQNVDSTRKKTPPKAAIPDQSGCLKCES